MMCKCADVQMCRFFELVWWLLIKLIERVENQSYLRVKAGLQKILVQPPIIFDNLINFLLNLIYPIKLKLLIINL